MGVRVAGFEGDLPPFDLPDPDSKQDHSGETEAD
jgi:hypothetical protein